MRYLYRPRFTAYMLAIIGLLLALSSCDSEDSQDCPPEICSFEVPEPSTELACTGNDGVVLVPEPGFTKNVITLTEIEGSDDYHLIISAENLEIIRSALEAGGFEYDGLRNHVNGVLVLADEDGEACDIGTRTYLRLRISNADIGDFIITSGIFNEAMIYILDNIDAIAESSYVQAFGGFIYGSIVETIAEKFAQIVVAAILK